MGVWAALLIAVIVRFELPVDDTLGRVHDLQLRVEGFHLGEEGVFELDAYGEPECRPAQLGHLAGTGFVIMRRSARTYEGENLHSVPGYPRNELRLGKDADRDGGNGGGSRGEGADHGYEGVKRGEGYEEPLFTLSAMGEVCVDSKKRAYWFHKNLFVFANDSQII